MKPSATAMTLIAEADGGMIPVVRIGASEESEPGDKRKRRALPWKEVRLSLVRHPAAVDPASAVTLGDVAATGENLKRLPPVRGAIPGFMVWTMACRGLPSGWNVIRRTGSGHGRSRRAS